MNSYSGQIEFCYNKHAMVVPYTFDMLGGNPHFYFRDKRGEHHTFFKGVEWMYGYTMDAPRGWSKEFLDALYVEFDKEIRYIYYKYKILGLNSYLSNDLCQER